VPHILVMSSHNLTKLVVMVLTRIIVAAIFVAGASAQCGGNFKIAGSSTVQPVATIWAQNYGQKCNIPIYTTATTATDGISVEGGGSSAGGGRVCANSARGTPVDVGTMSRAWRGSEASTVDNWNFQCKVGDTSRKVTRVEVAVDGITVVTKKNGIGDKCITLMGGLTQDQLRWIYSSYTIAQLQQTGWKNPLVSGATDNLWSSLNKGCQASEINLSGPDAASGTFEYFRENILTDFEKGETFDSTGLRKYFNSSKDEVIANYVIADDSAIGFFGFAYFFANKATLSAAPIKNRAGEFIDPDADSILSNDYNPLSRRIFMNVLTSKLATVRPYLEYGYSNAGDADVKQLGENPLPLADQILMLSRLQSSRGISLDVITCGTAGAIRVGGAVALRSAMTAFAGHYTSKCPKVDVALINVPVAATAIARVCGGTGPTDIGTTTSKIGTATSGNAYTYNCPTGSRKLIELVLLPGTFAYANNAPAVLTITRNFLRFALSDAGAKLVTLIGGTPVADSVRTTMLSRIPVPGGGFGCFAGESTVEVLNKGFVAMKDLSIGDMVKVNGGKFSEVYSFGHKEQDVDGSYLSIDTGLPKPLLITADHMVFVDNKPVRASAISVGDNLSLVDGLVAVKKITSVSASGAFAPFTKEGTIIVDSIVASSYVSLQNDSNFVIGGVNTVNMHYLAHIFQAPHRLICEINSAFCASESYENGVSVWVATPLAAALWLVKQNPVVMTAAFIPAFAFVLVAAVAEAVVVSPFMVLAAVAAAFVMSRKIKKSA
jgi:ABC-type phosphate transport system substrate-binding protein